MLAYDDVLNIQRQSVYTRRRTLLTGDQGAIDEELSRVAFATASQSDARATDRASGRWFVFELKYIVCGLTLASPAEEDILDLSRPGMDWVLQSGDGVSDQYRAS